MRHSEDDAVHKILHEMKMKTCRQNQLQISVLVYLQSSMELDIKRYMLYLSNAPLILLCYVSKYSGQNFIFFAISLFCYVMLCFKHSGQNFILFVFLYFAMLCYAVFQNIVAKIVYPLFFPILLCYALRIHFKT